MNPHSHSSQPPERESLPDPPDSGIEDSVLPTDQLLIAYLDGELDDTAAAALEARLATDSELRTRLLEYQRTWDMLDEVSRTQPGSSFVKSTIEMVVTSARPRPSRWHRWPLRIAFGLLAFCLPGWAAFQSVRHVQTLPYRQFVDDLSFWENVDMYDEVDNIEFLERLNAEGLFAEELTDVR